MALNIDDLKRQAESGSIVAKGMLGMCYLYGIDVPIDYGEAHRLLLAAVEQGAARPATALATMYARGLGVERDVLKAICLYEQAAAAGEFMAKIELARIYRNGIGVNVDIWRACSWYEQALEQRAAVHAQAELCEAEEFVDKHRR